MLKQLLRILVPMPPRADAVSVPQTRSVFVWTTMVPKVETAVDMLDVVEQKVKVEELSHEQVPQDDQMKKKRVSFSTGLDMKNKSVVEGDHSSPPKAKSSSSQKACRYCFEPNGNLISPCKCSGSQSFVHIDCMKEWIQKSSQVNCGICRATVQGFRSRKHCLYYSAECFIVTSVLLLVMLYFGSNFFIRNCTKIIPGGKCSPVLISAAVMVHVASPLFLFVIFWLSTFFVKFKVMITVYDPTMDSCIRCPSQQAPSLNPGKGDERSRQSIS